jgi:cytochrome c oxidase assembly protein subunit 15
VQLTPSRYRWVCGAALGLLVAIVITGAAVRLTGSGLGCDDWPNCNDERLVDVSSSHAAIEQVNRLFTGLVSAAVIAAVLGSLWRRPRRRDLVWLSLGLVAGVLGQIVLGGIVVIFDLHPILVQGHMVLSLALVAVAVVLYQRACEPDGVPLVPATGPPARRLAWTLAALTGAAILTGTVVTAAGPHAGDPDVVDRLWELPDAMWVHVRASAAFGVAFLVGLAYFVRHRPATNALLKVSAVLLALLLVQMAVGEIQYRNELPWWLVLVHVSLAAAIWSVTVALVTFMWRAPRLKEA